MRFLRKIQYNAPVVLTFTFLSLAALLLDFATQGKSTQLLFCVYRSSPKNPLTYVRLLGHVLGHASVSHYMNNMMLFLLLGPMIEEKYGSLRMLAMILVTALVTGLANLALFPNVALLGASGVVFMLVILSSMVRMEDGKIPLTMVLIVILYLGQEVYSGLVAQDSISQLSHILGGVCGGLFGLLLSRSASRKKKSRAPRSSGSGETNSPAPQEPEEASPPPRERKPQQTNEAASSPQETGQRQPDEGASSQQETEETARQEERRQRREARKAAKDRGETGEKQSFVSKLFHKISAYSDGRGDDGDWN